MKFPNFIDASGKQEMPPMLYQMMHRQIDQSNIGSI